MYELCAYAVVAKGFIEVTVFGLLPNSCYVASIEHYYPGTIVYNADPGHAQVFIKETYSPSTQICSLTLCPWAQTIVLRDSKHTSVEIYLNSVKELNIPVLNAGEYFKVVQMTGGIVPSGAFSIVPDNFPETRLYTLVFGPATYKKCDQWIKSHPNEFQPFLDAFSLGYRYLKESKAEGGGSEMPRGVTKEIDWINEIPNPRVELFGGGSEAPRG